MNILLLNTLLALIKSFILKFINIAYTVVFAASCPCCKKQVSEIDTICHECWNSIVFITGDACKVCSKPLNFLNYYSSSEYCSLRCKKSKSRIAIIRAATIYSDAISTILHQFKYEKKTHRVNILTNILLHAHRYIKHDIDLIIPVPMHRSRLKIRGYNQSALLAKRFAQKTNTAWASNILYKAQDTPSQMSLSQKQRYKNLRNAFYVSKKGRKILGGLNILLIDDVITTGTTAAECARTLLKANAATVSVISIAKTSHYHA